MWSIAVVCQDTEYQNWLRERLAEKHFHLGLGFFEKNFSLCVQKYKENQLFARVMYFFHIPSHIS